MMRLSWLPILTVLSLAACDSTPSVTVDDSSEDDGRDDADDDDGTKGDAGPSIRRGDGGSTIEPIDGLIEETAEQEDDCEPVECSDLDADCGAVSDGCGGIVQCGTCAEDARCGIIEANVCTPLADLCVPTPRADACDGKQCGLAGDGCGGSHDCGTCGEGEACGVQERFRCDNVFGGDGGGAVTGGCRPQTEAQACAGRECGIAFDGCGSDEENTFDCAELNGGCAEDEYCGLLAPFQCDALPTVECDAAPSCEALGWACGTAIDDCGNLLDCADEGLACPAGTHTCVGGVAGPTECVAGGPGGVVNCDVCDSIPDCSGEAQETRLTGRVITPGASANDTGNHVGVPNAFVYILRNNDQSQLPPIESGIPIGGTSCDRCDDQDLGPVLSSDTTDSSGEFALEGDIPVGEEFLLVVKIGKFRRGIAMTLEADAACGTTAIPSQDTRLPRSSTDGIGAHLPKIAISTGQIDAMECVFSKMGIEVDEFSEPGAAGDAPARVHMYRANGASMATGSTDHTEMHQDIERVFSYDMLVFDCEGAGFGDYDASDPNIRAYVNSGGRMFASHLSFTWIADNGTAPYSAASAEDTGLAPSANFTGATGPGDSNATGIVSLNRPQAPPNKIQAFADWLVNENVATFDDPDYTFAILDPRELSSTVNEFSEEFVYRDVDDETWVQQYAFNTPYGAPEEAICGRVAYSGFHVSSGGSFTAFLNAEFPEHCAGDLTNQEKVLLYMLFDLGACVTTDVPDPPVCEPEGDCTGRCGAIPDGCGGTIDCTCPEDQICLPGGICGSTDCLPTTCDEQNAECGAIADGCGSVINCGPCPEGEICGLLQANQCARPPNCPPLDCEDQAAECGVIGDGCGGQVDCGPCPPGEVCGLNEAYKCDPPNCDPLTCEDEDAECGLIGDGCGDLVDCGPCPPGFICGLESPNQCSPEPGDAH
jgi:hypothetical protein